MTAAGKKVTILYNVPLPRALTEMVVYSREKANEIIARHPGLDLSESAVMEELHDMVQSLAQFGYLARAVNINDDFGYLVEELTQRRPDVIFNLCESMNAVSKHEAYVAGIYELLRIPYTGAAPEALAIGCGLALFVFFGVEIEKWAIRRGWLYRESPGVEAVGARPA